MSDQTNYSIYRNKRSPFWWASINPETGRDRFSTKIEYGESTKDLALEVARAAYYKELKYNKLDIVEKERITLDNAFGTYLDYEGYKHSSGWKRTVNTAIDSFTDFFSKKIIFDEITTAGLAAFLKSKPHLSNATKNRYIAVFRRVATFFDNFEEATPKIKFKTLTLPEPDSRAREISQEDFAKLYSKLPGHLKPIVLFALLTGLRKANVLQLDWKQVNIFKGIIQVSVKSRRPGGKLITIPISESVKELLIGLEPQKEGRIFTYQGRPIKDVKRAFKTARYEMRGKKKVCWLPDFRFHDLRHSFACWFINEGGSLKEIQDALGHSDPRTSQKYARMKKETLKTSIDKVTAFKGWR